MEKPIFLVLFVFFLLSLNQSCCNGCADDGMPVNPPPTTGTGDQGTTGGDDGGNQGSETDEYSLNLDGVNDLDFSQLSALSFEGSSEVNTNGNFDLINDNEDGFPTLFLMNDEILFGFYPDSSSEGGEVSIYDILDFYIISHPRIGLYGIETEKLKQTITGNSNIDSLKDLLVQSLNEGNTPTGDETFIERLDFVVNEVIEENDFSDKTTNKSSTDVRFQYTRSGEFTLPEVFPLVSAVGVYIRNVETAEYELSPRILSSETVFLSNNFFANVYDDIFSNISGNTTNLTRQISNEGNIRLVLTNKNFLNTELSDKVFRANTEYFVSSLLSLFAVVSTKMLKSGPCIKQIEELIISYEVVLADILNKNRAPNASEWTQITTTIGEFLLGLGVECLNYGQAALSFLNKIVPYWNAIVAISSARELGRFFDHILQYDINEVQEFEFSNEMLFGELTRTDISDNIIYATNNEVVEHETEIEETKIKYLVGTSPFSFKKEEFQEPAKFLLYNVKVESGDSELLNTSSEEQVTSEGKLNIEARFKNEDSKISVTPTFADGPPFPKGVEPYEFEIKKLNSILLSTLNLDFGEVELNQNKELTFQIQNPNPVEVDISISANNGAFTTAETEYKLLANETKTITVTFKPSELLSYSAELEITGKGVPENSKIQLLGLAKEEHNEVDLSGTWNFNFDIDGLTGTCTSYNADGSTNSVQNDAALGFYNSIFINEEGILIDNSFNGYYDSSYSLSDNTFSFQALHDTANRYDLITFTGTWSEERQAFVGQASRDVREWFGSDRNQLSSDCPNVSEYAEFSKSRYILE